MAHILSAGVRKYLYRECRDEVMGEIYEVNLARFLCSFHRSEVTRHNNNDEIHCQMGAIFSLISQLSYETGRTNGK